MSADPRFLHLLERLKDLHVAKNAGYSGDSTDRFANFRLSEDFGIPAWKGALVRMSDKYIRIKNLAKNPTLEQVGERIEDTLLDLAAYALIVLVLYQETKKDVLEEEVYDAE